MEVNTDPQYIIGFGALSIDLILFLAWEMSSISWGVTRRGSDCTSAHTHAVWPAQSITLFRRDFYSGSNPNSFRINCLNEQI